MNLRSWAALLLALFAASMLLVIATSGRMPQAAGGAHEPAAGARAAASIILVSLDTLRADHLSSYGHERPTSPHLDAFAAESVRFSQALAQATGTVPSHLSLFTSLNPPHFRITRADGQNEGQASTRLQLPRQVTSLADTLREQGYQTLALTDGGFMSGAYGQKQGFERYLVNSRLEKGLEVSNARLDALLAARRSDAPLFLFVHTFDVHAPYGAPEPYTRAFSRSADELEAELGFPPDPHVMGQHKDALTPAQIAEVAALYDSGILWTDQSLAHLFEILARHGLYDDAVIAVTSDHGEEFFEHGGFNHGVTVYEEQLAVPLLIRLPGGREAGRVVEQPVALIDVAPTLLEAAGLRVPDAFRGQSLLASMTGQHDARAFTSRPVYFEAATTPTTFGLRRGHWKLIRSGTPPRLELYDLASDPGEQHDLAPTRPELGDELAGLLTSWVARMEREGERQGWLAIPDPRVRSHEEREALRALGYVE